MDLLKPFKPEVDSDPGHDKSVGHNKSVQLFNSVSRR